MKPFDMSYISMADLCVTSELSTDFILLEEFNSFNKKIPEEPKIGTTEPPPSRHPTTKYIKLNTSVSTKTLIN
jgi:hypothetical protein